MSESASRRRLALRAIVVSYRAGCRHPALSPATRDEMRYRALAMLDRLDVEGDAEFAALVAAARKEVEQVAETSPV